MFFIKKGAKIFQVKFSESNKWGKDTHELVERDLHKIRVLQTGRYGFPIDTSINIIEPKIRGIAKGILNLQLKKEFANFSRYITITDQLESLIYLTLSSDELVINLGDIKSLTIHSISNRDKEDFVQNLSKDIVLGIAVVFSHLGNIDFSNQI